MDDSSLRRLARTLASAPPPPPPPFPSPLLPSLFPAHSHAAAPSVWEAVRTRLASRSARSRRSFTMPLLFWDRMPRGRMERKKGAFHSHSGWTLQAPHLPRQHLLQAGSVAQHATTRAAGNPKAGGRMGRRMRCGVCSTAERGGRARVPQRVSVGVPGVHDAVGLLGVRGPVLPHRWRLLS